MGRRIATMIFSPEKARDPISATFEFSPSGRLRAIYLNANSERDQVIVQKGLRQLFRPGWFGKLKGMVKRGT